MLNSSSSSNDDSNIKKPRGRPKGVPYKPKQLHNQQLHKPLQYTSSYYNDDPNTEVPENRIEITIDNIDDMISEFPRMIYFHGCDDHVESYVKYIYQNDYYYCNMCR